MSGVRTALAALTLMLAVPATALAVPQLQVVTPLSSDYNVGDINAPSATVRLTEATASDTFVPVTSSDPTTVTVAGGGVTVPTAASSAPILITCIQQGAATLHASLGVENQDATVRCLTAGAPVVRLDS